MDANRHNFWDIILKSVTVVTIIFGGGWALFEHFDTEEQKVNSTFWNKRMELYLRTSEAAATIAGATTPAEVTKEIREFWQLFHGPMSVIEDGAVKKEMQEFAGLVRAFQGPGFSSNGSTTKPVSSEFASLSATDLHLKKKDAATELADAMHASLKESWSKPFRR